MTNNLTHFDEHGNARMVDVSQKDITERVAIASGKIYLNELAYNNVKNKKVSKGDVLTVAQVAGIMAAKKTSELVPMAHPIFLEKLDLTFELNDEERFIEAKCIASLHSKTGVEMEAITGVSVALITIYDMCKSVDRSMLITDIKLSHKSGGKSGEYNAE